MCIDDAEIQEEELEAVVDESAEQEFSFKDFVLRSVIFVVHSFNALSQNSDVGGSHDLSLSSLLYVKWLNTSCSFQPSKKCQSLTTTCSMSFNYARLEQDVPMILLAEHDQQIEFVLQ